MSQTLSPRILQLLIFSLGFSSVAAHAQAVAAASFEAAASNGDAHSAPAPAADPAIASRPSQFVLGAADVIRVNVWKNNDLSQTVTIGPDGFVSLPLLGDVHAAGLTSNQLAQELSGKLATYVVSPQVTVSVIEIRSRQVYVLGQVGKPGGYPLITPISILQLIAQAGGLSAYANRKEIVILRESKGNTERIRISYVSAINGDDKQNIMLQPGDTVVVR
jgi:polysaccharide export outer membrane protein